VTKDPKNDASEIGEISLDGESSGLISEELEKAFNNKNSEATKESASHGSSSANISNEEHNKIKNEYLYLRAEFDNYKKNAIKERSELVKYGAERFIRQLLSVIDNFDRAMALEVNSENYKDFLQGIELTSNEFKKQLSNIGVRIEDPTGKAFNPNYHEALGSEETSQIEAGHITKVFQKAYWLHDRIIRPAQVIIAKPPSTSNTKSE
jgi:molecular chaperone GrpE